MAPLTKNSKVKKLEKSFNGIVPALYYNNLCINKAGNHVVLMIGFMEFRAGIRIKHVRK